MHTGVYYSLDFTAEGKSVDFLSIPFSVDRSPYFQVKVPMVRIKRGTGPRVLLMAGNHGDEYEGELSLTRLIRRLNPDMIKGEITILPLANTPAVMAARRRSPLDNGNLNRAFPGDLAGSPTFRIAHFLERELFPRHDVVFDLHSGGTTMAHLPCALIERQGPPDRFAQALSLMKATGLRHGFVAENGATAPTSMAAAARAGAIGLSGEFGGGGTVNPETMAATSKAIDNLLLTLGVVEDRVLSSQSVDRGPMQLLALDSHEQSIFATRRGWFEPSVILGARVEKGDVAGWYHDLSRIDTPEETLRFQQSGIVIAHRLPTDSEAGDCLIQVARPIDERSVLNRPLQ
jgi:predicted deacylase